MIPFRCKRDLPVVWRAHIGLDLPNDLARRRGTSCAATSSAADALRVLARGVRVGGARPRPRRDHPAVDRRVLAQEPGARLHRHRGDPASQRARGRRGPGRRRRRSSGSTGAPALVQRRARCTEAQPLRLDTPLVTQVSRWDRLKDPLGVMHGVRRARADRQRGAPGARRARRRGGRRRSRGRRGARRGRGAPGRTLPTEVRREGAPAGLPMEDADENAAIVNALQRRSDVVVQKSLAEGFGLTVSEAMWKGAPRRRRRGRRHPGPDRGRRDRLPGRPARPRRVRPPRGRAARRPADRRAHRRRGPGARARPLPRAAPPRAVGRPARARPLRGLLGQALGGMPGLILLDSSHQYAHTLRELDLWVPRMAPGSLLLAHDTSTFATTFDSTGEGGVQRAFDEWLPAHPEAAFVSLNRHVAPGDPGTGLAYMDGCGLGILQQDWPKGPARACRCCGAPQGPRGPGGRPRARSARRSARRACPRRSSRTPRPARHSSSSRVAV